ncbi:MAG: BglG family transcription antiterminator [Erysipelotrichaceae bacterium]
MNYYLDKRCEDILKILIYSNNYVKVDELANSIGVSRRSIYYDLKKINDFLSFNDIEILQQHRLHGIVLTETQRNQLRQLTSSDKKTIQVLTPTERKSIQICELLIKRKDLYIEDLAEICDVSRNTIVNDLKQVASDLQAYNLSISYNIRNGYTIIGDPVKKRAVFFMEFPSLWSFYYSNMSHQQSTLINDTIAKLKMIEKQLNTQYVSGILPTLAMYIICIASKNEDIIFKNVNLQEIISTNEYDLVEQFFPSLILSEKVYVSLHLLGSRLQSVPVNVSKDDGQANKLAWLVVEEFQRISYINFENKDELINAITAHLKSSLYRYKYGIQLSNPMLKDIKSEYSDLFEMTRNAVNVLEDQLSVMISDDEVAYLTLHFGSYIIPNRKAQKGFRILVVCSNGVGTSIMLKNEIKSLVPQASAVDNTSLANYQPNHNYDVVISTSYIENEKNLIVVHPILTEQDRVIILRKCLYAEPSSTINIKDIVELAAKYMPENLLGQFKDDLNRYYAISKIKNIPAKESELTLLDCLDEAAINICFEDCDWKSALRISAEPLIKKDLITENYIDAIISQQINQGVHMFLSDGLVLAHSATDNGVKRMGISLAVFKKPVTFLNGKQAQLIFTLAAEDQRKHITILNDILKLFSVKSNIALLANSNSSKEVIDFIAEKLK